LGWAGEKWYTSGSDSPAVLLDGHFEQPAWVVSLHLVHLVDLVCLVFFGGETNQMNSLVLSL
jgi:hypothetical protein